MSEPFSMMMSPCNLQVISNIKDLKSIHNFLFEASNEDELVQWDNEEFENAWETNDKFDTLDDDEIDQATSESDEEWFQKCHVAVSPLADFLCVCYKQNAVFLSNHSSYESSSFTITWKGELSDKEDESIEDVLCIPLVSLKRTSCGSCDWTAFIVGQQSISAWSSKHQDH